MPASHHIYEYPRSAPLPATSGLPCEPSLDDPRLESCLLRLHATIDVPQFWSTVRSILDDLLPNDACVVYLKFPDFSKSWHASHILTTPRASKPSEWLTHRRAVDMMPAFILAHPGMKQYQLSEVVPNTRKLRRSEFFRRYMEPEGWHYTACSLFWDGDHLKSEIAIRRTAEQGDFTSREMALLNRLHPHIQTTLQRLASLENLMTTRSVQESSLLDRVTPAERALVHLIREGCSNKEIAARLGKSARTVRTQLSSVYKKIGVTSRSRLVARLLNCAP